MHIETELKDGTIQKMNYSTKALDGLKIDGKIKVVFESQEDFDSLIDELSDKSSNPAFRNFLMIFHFRIFFPSFYNIIYPFTV